MVNACDGQIPEIAILRTDCPEPVMSHLQLVCMVMRTDVAPMRVNAVATNEAAMKGMNIEYLFLK
jgi:hypothetical protein